MATVYLAEDIRNERQVALEVLKPEELDGIRTTPAAEPTHYDHMAWFNGGSELGTRGAITEDECQQRVRIRR